MSRFRLARLGSAVAVGVLVAGVLSAPALAAGTGTVQGVFTTSSGAPISGATVTAYSGEGDYLDDTTTSSSGGYRLAGIAAGGIQLHFAGNGLEHWAPGVPDQEHAQTYTLAAGGTLTVDEKQPETGTLAGHFTDAAGQGVPYASVTVQGVDSWSYVYGTTDDQGAYAIDVLPGTYKVSFRWDNATQWAVQSPDEDHATVYAVTAGRATTVDDHELPTGTLGGRITASDGSPLANASVTLHRGGEQLGWTSTDDDGAYSLGEVLAGDGYSLSYAKDGGTEVYVPGTADPAKARLFPVAAGAAVTVDDTQPAVSTVHGKLSGAGAGYPVTVQLVSDDNWVQLSGETAADGTWSVGGVFPGSYKVSFADPNGSRTQWAYGKSSESDAAPIAVAAGADVTVDDSWLPGATLVVTAVDAATGVAVPDYCAYVNTPGDGSGCAASGGNKVTLTNLPGGAYTVQADPSEDSYYLSSQDLPVTLTPGRTTRITIKLVLGGKVSYTTADHATGAPLARGCAIFRTLGTGGLGDGYGNCTEASGRAVSAHMAAATYEIYAKAPAGYGDQWVGAAGGTGDQKAAARVRVRAGRTVAAPPILFDKAGTITGVVTDASGAPLKNLNVAWSAWGDAGPGWGTDTDARGKYTIKDLGPYAWPLLFGGAGYPRQWSGHVGNRFQAEGVPVVAGGSTTYDFTPVKGATLRGTVTAPAGASWRIHAFNAATGDQMSTFDAYDAGPGGAYELPVIGGQQVKIDWSWYRDEASHRGWYDDAVDIATATKVGVPANGGVRTLNLTLE